MSLVPNIITISRSLAAFFLLLTAPFSPAFFVIYIVCGIGDMLDGYIARKWRASSALGATLDSMGDCVFVFVVLYKLLPVLILPPWALYWVGGIFILKGSTFVIGLVRYGGLAFLHTYLNKIAGISLFCFPVFYHFGEISMVAAVLCALATLAAGEELVITVWARELNRDRKGLFFQ